MQNHQTTVNHKPPSWTWLPLTAVILLGSLGVLLFYLNSATAVPVSWAAQGGVRNQPLDWLNAIHQSFLGPLVAVLFGVLIVRQRPHHRIGWLLVVIGLISATMVCLQEWAVYGYYTVAGAAPGWALSGWITNWAWIVFFFFVLLMVAVFPDGTFLSPRWQTILSICLGLFVILLFVGAAVETPMSSAAQIPNPFVAVHPARLYDSLFTLGVPFMPITSVAVLAAVIVRFWRSYGRERQQIKWLLAGMALMAMMIAIGLGLSLLGQTIGDLLVNASVLAPLIGIGVALLRHQLYDIDVIIRRTLLYTAVSAVLAVIYFGSVILLQQLFSQVMGQQSAVAIVISTLLIAALFNPLRHRLQAFIDRRFYRQKYDAQQVLAQFAQTARDEVELDELTAELLRVIQQTMQPEELSIWLKSESS